MRRLTLGVALAAVATGACAQIGAPPGGPERTVPPELLSVTPDSGTTNFRGENVVFEFDVVVNDRNIENQFLISPREGEPRVRWRRDRVEVRPRRGFRPNTAYTVTMTPGVADLRGNPMGVGTSVVFSTGPTLPAFMVAGRVFDWMNDRIAPGAVVEVIRRPDSLPYIGVADSTGQFAVGPLDSGTYTVRAFIDGNRNQTVDRAEPWDSLAIVVRDASPFVELLAAPRDTLPPRLLTVTARDSVSFVASFDQPLSAPPEPTLAAPAVRVVGADSTPLRVVGVWSRAQYDSVVAARDTTQRDTTTRRDTTTVAPPAVAPVPGAAPPVLEPTPSRPAPLREVIIELDPGTPLRPGTSYRVTMVDVRGLTGRTRTSERVLTVPAARRDTTPPATPPAGARPP